MMKKLFLGFLVAIALGACSSEENEPEYHKNKYKICLPLNKLQTIPTR